MRSDASYGGCFDFGAARPVSASVIPTVVRDEGIAMGSERKSEPVGRELLERPAKRCLNRSKVVACHGRMIL